MAVKFKGPQPVSARILHVLLGLLNWILAGMLVYLRWFPLERVLIRLEERGAAFPAWLSLAVTVGTVIIAGFLAFRGWRLLRTGLAG